MKKIISVFMLTIMFSMLSLTSISSVAYADSNWDQFMTGSTAYWAKEMANKAYSGKVADAGGVSAYRIELRDTDKLVNGSKRSEIAVRQADKAAGDYTYEWSMFLPAGGTEDYALDPEGSEIIAQWHNVPDPGEEWTCPPVAIHTGAYKNSPDHYTLDINYDAGQMSTNRTLTYNSYDLGSFVEDKGKWVDWKVHVKWGWQDSQKPILQVYKNGSKVFESTQPNTTNDQQGVKMKLGVYKWDWAQAGANNASILHKRVIYYNNVSIAETPGEPVINDQAAAPQPVIEPIEAVM